MKLLQGTLDYESSKLIYHIVICDKCVYIYIGTPDQIFDNLSYSIQTQFEDEPTVATLITNGESDDFSELLSQKICIFLLDHQ